MARFIDDAFADLGRIAREMDALAHDGAPLRDPLLARHLKARALASSLRSPRSDPRFGVLRGACAEPSSSQL